MIVEMEMEHGGEDSASVENRNTEKEVEEERSEGSDQGDGGVDKGKNNEAVEKKRQDIQDKGKKRKGNNNGTTQSCKPFGDPEDRQHKGSSVSVKQSNQDKHNKTTEDSRESNEDSHSEINECRQSQDNVPKRIGEGGLKGVPLSMEKKDRSKVVFVDLIDWPETLASGSAWPVL